MSNYFELFPNIEYNSKTIKKIVSRVAIETELLNQIGDYYFYTLKENERPDTIANDYYGDSRLAWLVLLSNQIIDPYYQWPLPPLEFDKHMSTKYGSLQNAQSKIIWYKKKTETLYVNQFNGNIIEQTEYDNLFDKSPYVTYTDEQEIRVSEESYDLRNDQADFTPVYAYNHEQELNEQRREIKLIKKQHVNSIVRQIKALLNDS